MTELTRYVLACALCLGACGSQDDEPETSPASVAVLKQTLHDARAADAAAPLVECAIDYALCLLQDPFAIPDCTRAARECGLFLGTQAPDTPVCATDYALCLAAHPFDPGACPSMPCP